MIIGILGRSRAGKDTVAKLITMNSVTSWDIVRLAQPIKDAVCALYDIPREHVENHEKELVIPDHGITPRQAMQDITENYMRKHGQGFFSRRVFNKYSLTDNIIIPDVRFRADVEEIKSRGGFVIKVVRTENAITYTCEHTVDTAPCDFSVLNDGTLNELEEKVTRIMDVICQKSQK